MPVSVVIVVAFQSTLPMRGATRSYSQPHFGTLYFNPHSPCGERRRKHLIFAGNVYYFNPHSPCGERQLLVSAVPIRCPFQSTLPMRGATLILCFCFRRGGISIHTPHAGSDFAYLSITGHISGISIHTPHAGSDDILRRIQRAVTFISIHTPHAGSDCIRL